MTWKNPIYMGDRGEESYLAASRLGAVEYLLWSISTGVNWRHAVSRAVEKYDLLYFEVGRKLYHDARAASRAGRVYGVVGDEKVIPAELQVPVSLSHPAGTYRYTVHLLLGADPDGDQIVRTRTIRTRRLLSPAALRGLLLPRNVQITDTLTGAAYPDPVFLAVGLTFGGS